MKLYVKLKGYKCSSPYLSGKPDQKLSAEYFQKSSVMTLKMETKIDKDLELMQKEKGGYVFLRENYKKKCKKWENEGVSTLSICQTLTRSKQGFALS